MKNLNQVQHTNHRLYLLCDKDKNQEETKDIPCDEVLNPSLAVENPDVLTNTSHLSP